MRPPDENPNIRKGKFLWMDQHSREKFLQKLSGRISEGYYSSDRVLNRIVDELSPVFSDIVEHEIS